MHADRITPEFDRYAPCYSELLGDPLRDRFATDPLHFHRRKLLLIQRIFTRAGLDTASHRWLDVGCGRGELLHIAGSSFAQATGCDPSAGMISPSSSFRVAHQPSPTELPFDNASFDFITVVCVLHHVHGHARDLLASEIRRVLVPGGLCCIIEHNPWNPITRAIVRRCPVDVDAELLGANVARALLLRAGFQALSSDYFLFAPEKLFYRMRKIEEMLRKLPFGGQYALLARAPR